MNKLRRLPADTDQSPDLSHDLYAGNSLNPPRPLRLALARGIICRCPACGVGPLFTRYLNLSPFCGHCSEALHHARPDDAPPYFVMLIVGHIVVPTALLLETVFKPPLVFTTVLLALLSCALCLMLLPPVKGMIVAVQWTFWMHRFDPHQTGDAPYQLTVSTGNERASIVGNAASGHLQQLEPQ